jgi:uncharacterized membrane protein YgdD (TMEM256/DUF423 family)
VHKGFLRLASILAIITVISGAFAAHTLKGKIGDHALVTFETAVRYQFYHVIALFLTGIVYKDFAYQTVRWAGWFFVAGIVLFSGSLYVLAIKQAIVSPGFKWIGPLTPIGGLAFIMGWALLAFSFFKRNKAAAL